MILLCHFGILAVDEPAPRSRKSDSGAIRATRGRVQRRPPALPFFRCAPRVGRTFECRYALNSASSFSSLTSAIACKHRISRLSRQAKHNEPDRLARLTFGLSPFPIRLWLATLRTFAARSAPSLALGRRAAVLGFSLHAQSSSATHTRTPRMQGRAGRHRHRCLHRC